METIVGILGDWRAYVPLLIAVAGATIVLTAAQLILRARDRRRPRSDAFATPLVMLVLTAVCVVWIVLVLPVSEQLQSQLLSLFGLALTAVIAFSSTTFVANAMAGLMLRAVGNFRPGDFIHVEEKFGKVTERALFHTEIQTEDRDLTTLPNLYLIAHPVTVVRESGTIVSASLSLGYDVDHRNAEALLLEAATRAELQEPFVQVRKLGDFSVEYRIAGFLEDVSRLLTVRSRLMREALDSLHGAGVQIMSPTFMGQWRLDTGEKILPQPVAAPPPPPPESGEAPEEIIFDKADLAASITKLEEERTQLLEKIEELSAIKPRDDATIERLRKQVEEIVRQVEAESKSSEES